MGNIIAVSGKGGVGKTIFATLLIRKLVKSGKKSILAIDADPDSNLPDALGISVERSLGDIREELTSDQSELPPDYSKMAWLEGKIFEITAEMPNFDIIVMGKPEGPGCYCAINHMLREIIDSLPKSYEYTIIDAEAGLEHLSRRTTQSVDNMIVVTDLSIHGFKTAERIKNLSKELGIKFKHLYLVVNRVDPSHEKMISEKVKSTGLEFVGVIPEEAEITEYSLVGKSLLDLPESSSAVKAVEDIAKKIRLT